MALVQVLQEMSQLTHCRPVGASYFPTRQGHSLDEEFIALVGSVQVRHAVPLVQVVQERSQGEQTATPESKKVGRQAQLLEASLLLDGGQVRQVVAEVEQVRHL